MKVTFDDKPVEANVCIAQVVFWNRGNSAIRQEDFLDPPAVVVEGRVIAVDIRRTTRPESNVTASIDPSDEHRVKLNWRILEKADGAAVQITYLGPAGASISMSGSIVGQKSISRPGKVLEERQNWSVPGYITVIVLTLCVATLSAFVLVGSISKMIKQPHTIDTATWGATICSAAVVLLAPLQLILTLSPLVTTLSYRPPFEF